MIELSTTSPAYNAMVSYENQTSKASSNTIIVYKPISDHIVLDGMVLTDDEILQRQREKTETLMYSTKDAVTIDSIFKHIVNNQINIIHGFYKFIEKDEYESMSKLIITFSIGCNNALRILRYFIYSDIKEDVNNINRNYSFSSLLISNYLEKTCQQYIKDILRQFILQLVQDKAINFKYDLENSENSVIHNEFSNLITWTNKLSEIICSQDSLDKMPMSIKVIAMFFHEIWPQDDQGGQGVSNFLINKLFVPALISPQLYDLIPPQIHLNSRSSSNLSILARFLSTCITTYSSDEYQEVFDSNQSLIQCKQTIKQTFKESQYFKSVLSARFSTQSYQYSNEAPMSQLHFLHRILCNEKSTIRQMYQSIDAASEFEKLMDLLPDYNYRVSYQFLTPSEIKSVKSYMESKNEEITYIGYIQKNGKKGFVKRILVVGIYRIVTFKMNGKLGRDGHIMDLQEIISPNNQQYELVFKGHRVHATTEDCDHTITCIRRIYEYCLYNWPYSLKMKLKIQPSSRLEAMSPPDHTPTSAMVGAYKCLCSYYTIPIKQTIAWYIEHAFNDPKYKVFNLKVFTKHTRELPTNQELIPLIHSLRYDWFFEEFIIKEYKLDNKELLNEIGSMLSSNSTINKLILSNLSLPKEFMMTLFDTIQSQKSLKLTFLDISNNQLDDKSLNSFFSYLQYGNTNSLTTLDCQSIGMKESHIKPFVDSLRRGNLSNLTSLNISNNKINDQAQEISRWLTNEGKSLKHLDLSETLLKIKNFQLSDQFSSLESLNLNRNLFRSKEDTQLLSICLSNLPKLLNLSLNKTMIPSDSIKEILLFLTTNDNNNNSNNSNNSSLFSNLSISENSIQRPLITGMISMNAFNLIKDIDFSDNDLTDGGIKELCRSLYGNQIVTSLNISGCFRGSPGAQRSKAISALSSFINSSSSLETLLMRGGQKSNQQLQRCIVPLLLSLGNLNTRLKKLDVSNHQFSNFGANALGKAIILNKSISTLILDNNSIGTIGYANLKNALKQNYTIKELPIPLFDITETLKYGGTTIIEQKKLRSLLFKIELYLSRNQSL
ncbi:hypothetical protein RB653_002762 [Dictyostelium firmibasis]|uniref:Ras-GAP domain-containing protein n=1 Tax=Dictyostelium firmibasis TaxID=79012 RepID=A0AAN7TR90_9MYCE